MFNMNFYITLFLITSFFVGFNNLDLDKKIPMLESEIEEFILKNQIASNKLFYYYALAARNLRKKNQHDLAIKYYRKSLNEKCEEKEHCLKALSELVFLLEEEKKFSDLRIEIQNLEKMAQQIGYLKINPEYQFVIDYFKVISSQELTKTAIGKDYSYFEDTIYYELILQHEFETRMRKELYSEAYQMFQTHHHKISQHELRSAHDLLAFLLKKNSTKWYCEDSIKEFKQSNAASIKICLTLLDRIYQKKVAKFDTSTIPNELSYLIPAINKVFN